MRWVLVCLLATALAAAGSSGCDDSDGDADGDADLDGDSDLDADGDSDADDESDGGSGCMTAGGACTATACHGAPFALTCLGGTVSLADGSPAAAVPVAVCAGQRCFMGESDGSGFFSVGIGVPSSEDVAVYFPGEEHLTPFCAFDALCDGAVLLCHEFELHRAPTSGTAVPDGTLAADLRVERDGAAIVVPAGSEVLLPIGAAPWMSVSRFPLDEYVPCFVDPASPPAALYAVTPPDVLVIEPGSIAAPVLVPAGLDLPNDTGLPAGAVVDVYVVGGAHAFDAALSEGEWVPWTTATVTADGSRVRTAEGEGLGYLTWFALYPR